MLFADLRCLLLFPCPAVEAGFNLTAASLLFNILAGISVCLYDPSIEALENHRKHPRGERFKRLLKDYYPWESEPTPRDDAIEVLYSKARNPLAHSLGLDSPSSGEPSTIVIGKHFLREEEIAQLEMSAHRPRGLHATVSKEGSDFVISIPTLYWGTWRLLHKLFRDESQMQKAEEFLKDLEKSQKTWEGPPS